MVRSPVPNAAAIPTCFGTQHDPADLNCRSCPHQSKCKVSTASWNKIHSLSEVLAAHERSLEAPATDEARPEDTYDRLHREIFGRKSHRKDSYQNRHTFSKLLAFCLGQEVDLATYVAANMLSWQPWMQRYKSRAFRPTWLLGDKAKRTYHAYLARSNRRYNRGRLSVYEGTAFEHSSFIAELRRRLYLGEWDAAEDFVAAFVTWGRASWEDSVQRTEPCLEWRALQRGSGDPYYHDLCVRIGTTALQGERQFATLRVAADLAEKYQYGLSDRIGFRHFSWQSFAELIGRLFPRIERRCVPDLSGISGAEWHGAVHVRG